MEGFPSAKAHTGGRFSVDQRRSCMVSQRGGARGLRLGLVTRVMKSATRVAVHASTGQISCLVPVRFVY